MELILALGGLVLLIIVARLETKILKNTDSKVERRDALRE